MFQIWQLVALLDILVIRELGFEVSSIFFVLPLVLLSFWTEALTLSDNAVAIGKLFKGQKISPLELLGVAVFAVAVVVPWPLVFPPSQEPEHIYLVWTSSVLFLRFFQISAKCRGQQEK